MLVPQQAQDSGNTRQGSRGSLTALRRQLERPSDVSQITRQRLLDLAQRLARVQALGDEYHRVQFSPYAAAALDTSAAVV